MILNLAYPEKSDIKFTVSKFPDGQQSITLGTVYVQLHEPVVIKSRLNSFQDLELIVCANQAIKNINSTIPVELYVPYFLGARSDRQFEYGGVNYLKQVICPIINSQNFNLVTMIDPHSDVLEACINNFEKKSNTDLVRFALEDLTINLWRKTTDDMSLEFWLKHVWSKNQDIVLVSPDAGAFKKIFDVAKHFRIDNVVTASKVRNLKTGEILKTEVPNLPISTTENEFRYVIVDDICDGGRTFIELAKAIKEQRLNAEIYLVVSHGIFSAGFDLLAQYFDNIFTTNSVKDINDGTIVNTFSKNKTIKALVKQYNVF